MKVTTTRSPDVPFSQEIFDLILERIMCGESVNAICADAGMPSRNSFYRWVLKDDELRDKFDSALNARSHAMAEDLLAIADEPVGSLESGATDTGAVNKQRLQVDTRKWLMSKMTPKKYGDRVDHVSSDGSMSQKPTTIQLVAKSKDERNSTD